MMHACPQLLELDVFVHEISEKVFATIGERLTQLRILRMKLTGERIAATDAAFRSLTRLGKLQTVELIFDQNEEDVSVETIVAFLSGPSKTSFRVVRLVYADGDVCTDKFADVSDLMDDMMQDYSFQDGDIFGETTD